MKSIIRTALLAGLALLTLLPIYVSGANFFQCGDPLMHTSFVYLEAAPRITIAAAVEDAGILLHIG